MIDVAADKTETSPQTTTTTTVHRRLTTSQKDDDDLPPVNDEHHLTASISSSTNDDDVASDATVSLDGVPESAGKTWTFPSASGCSQQLFVPELMSDGGSGSPRLTVEDIYIEAMTLDAEIRVFRRHLNTAGRRELSRIINFCRDALHRKLLLRSVEAQEGLDSSARRSVSSENLSTPIDCKPLELIAETAV